MILMAGQRGNQYLFLPKMSDEMMKYASIAEIGATKKPNMYHIVADAQLSRRKTVVRTRATKWQMT